MAKKLAKNYKSFLMLKNKKIRLERFFHAFLPEILFRSTKIEYPDITRKTNTSAIR
jgi:hypothetical protein